MILYTFKRDHRDSTAEKYSSVGDYTWNLMFSSCVCLLAFLQFCSYKWWLSDINLWEDVIICSYLIIFHLTLIQRMFEFLLFSSFLIVNAHYQCHVGPWNNRCFVVTELISDKKQDCICVPSSVKQCIIIFSVRKVKRPEIHMQNMRKFACQSSPSEQRKSFMKGHQCVQNENHKARSQMLPVMWQYCKMMSLNV